MTQDLTTTTSSGPTPGTALAIIAPKPTVSKQEIAWVERQEGLVGGLKAFGCTAGFIGGLFTATLGSAAIVLTHGAAIPVLYLFGGTGVFGGFLLLGNSRFNKARRIYDACGKDATRLVHHLQQRGEQVLREAIEQGMVLTEGMDLPVQVDRNEWKILHITGVTPDAACDSTGKISYDAICIRAEIHDVEPGCKDGKLVRGRKTRYEIFSGYNYLERHYYVSTIHHRIELKKRVEIDPDQPQPEKIAPAPESILRPVVEPLWGAKPAKAPPHAAWAGQAACHLGRIFKRDDTECGGESDRASPIPAPHPVILAQAGIQGRLLRQGPWALDPGSFPRASRSGPG